MLQSLDALGKASMKLFYGFVFWHSRDVPLIGPSA